MKNLTSTLVFLFLMVQAFGQNSNMPVKKDTIIWVNQHRYEKIKSNRMFTEVMTDDEMAGILFSKAGRNLTGAFVCEILSGSMAVLFAATPPDKQDLRIVLGIGSAGFFIGSLVNLLSGYNKITKAGIILQHKGINLRVTTVGVALKF